MRLTVNLARCAFGGQEVVGSQHTSSAGIKLRTLQLVDVPSVAYTHQVSITVSLLFFFHYKQSCRSSAKVGSGVMENKVTCCSEAALLTLNGPHKQVYFAADN